ncbi:MAG TPA: ABC transporter ATP-binding protein [Candidatus Kapabacteria bacterium]|nr:ABC transporter ATP-binding protein [Candidatus Kapabacteria bacterium]
MSVIRRFLPFLKPYLPLLVLIVILSAVLSAVSAASIAVIWPVMKVIFPQSGSSSPVQAPAGIGGAFNGVKEWCLNTMQTFIIHPTDKLISLRNLCFLVIGIFVVKNIVKYITYVLNTAVEERIMKDVRDTLFRKAINLSIGFFNEKRAGDLISVVTNDVGTMNAAVTPMIGTVIREPMQALIMLVGLLAISPTLTLIAFSTSILSVVAVRFLTKYIKRYSQRIQNALAEITSRLQESFLNIRIIKGYAAERYEAARFEKETAWYVRSALKHSAMVNLMNPVNEIFAIVALSVVLFYGGFQVVEGSMKADELFTFLFLLFAIMQPVVATLSIPATIQRGLYAAERVFAVMDTMPTVVGGTRSATALRNELQLLNVGFSYRPAHPVIRDVTLTVKRGQTLALVGPSGGGKSTLMDLVIRLYDPLSGGIYLDGVDIREFTLESYHGQFGIVTQESILFNDSVRNNIAYGLDDISEEKIVEAARAANAIDFIERLPHGFDTPIGDRGVLLSGGQRQRLAIARALARDPQILLFDEATSALDTESEMLVQEAINKLLEDRTAIVIAHRLSTIKHAHMIAVVEEGAIVEYGTHEELLAAGSLYKRLYEVQFREDG